MAELSLGIRVPLCCCCPYTNNADSIDLKKNIFYPFCGGQILWWLSQPFLIFPHPYVHALCNPLLLTVDKAYDLLLINNMAKVKGYYRYVIQVLNYFIFSESKGREIILEVGHNWAKALKI